MNCEHKLSWIRQRPNGDFYCAVCRTVLYEQAELFGVVDGEQSRINRLLRERREARPERMDQHEQGDY